MDVILDTNIFVQDFLMSSVEFGLLFDYLKKTSSKILMPLIVYQELGEVYKSKLDAKSKAHETSRRSLEGALVDIQLPSITIDIASETRKYLDFVKKTLGIHDRGIIPFRDHYLSELVTRAIRRQKPFSEKGEEFRDALLWLTVLDIAREVEEETLAFISNDSRAFGQNQQLHETLLNEAHATGKQVRFYNSIGRFIEDHASQVEYITSSWLFAAIDFEIYSDTVAERLKEYLEHLTESDLADRGLDRLEFTGYLHATGPVTEENLTEYYVYEKSDGSLHVQVNFYIEYEAEFTSTERMRQERHSRYVWGDDDHHRIESKTVYRCLEAQIIFGVVIKDKQVVQIEEPGCYL